MLSCGVWQQFQISLETQGRLTTPAEFGNIAVRANPVTPGRIFWVFFRLPMRLPHRPGGEHMADFAAAHARGRA